MTNYYVRTDGSNSNTGTGPSTGAAWQTITKALGAAGIASGDTVYIAPGTYREVVTVAMTNPTSETLVIGDVAASQFSDLQGGDVIWTAYTTDDKTLPSSSATLGISTRDFLTFVDLTFIGADVAPTITASSGALNITFRRCLFFASRAGSFVSYSILVDTAVNWLFDSCIAFSSSSLFSFTIPTSTSADYDAEIVFKNCLLWSTGSTCISVQASGANSFKGGGVKVYNCTLIGGLGGFAVNSANIASSAGNQCEVYNCLFFFGGATAIGANTVGQIVEDYNYLIASTPRSNVTAGGNSQASSAISNQPYALLVHLGQERLYGQYGRPFFSPMLQSPLLGFGNDGSIGVQTEDAFGNPRPSGPARTWASALKGIGYAERPNTGAREATTVRTGTYALKLLGPSVQDVEIPVAAASTTVTVYARYDSAYGGGTLPRMRVMANAEIGVAEATDTAVGAADAWEQLSLNFTPTAAGIVTVRMMSDADGDGAAYFDDLAVA